MTAPRPGGENYLSRTLSLLDRQPWTGRRTIWSDGPCAPFAADLVADWRVVERPRRGPPNTHAFWDLLADAAGEPALVLEDDVDPSPGALPVIEAAGTPPPNLAFVSWFDPVTKGGPPIPGTVLVPASRILPAQARSYSVAAIAVLLAAGPGSKPGAGSDACVARALAPLGLPAAVVAPSLFQHVGHVSAVGGPPLRDHERLSASWLGPNVDARLVLGTADRMRLFGLA